MFGIRPFKLFRFLGVQVYLHWSWLIVAFLMVQISDLYDSKIWAAADYLALFAIVLVHEYGHALATRSVGGKAEHIVLWPFGGIAFVNAPPRPGATLWSVAAGPLVNVALFPLLLGLVIVSGAEWNFSLDAFYAQPDALRFIAHVFITNAGLLFFNMLPIYPLDGGQILQSLLWFVAGRRWALRIAASLGLVLSILLGVFAVVSLGSIWLAVMCLFLALQAYHGVRIASVLPEEGELREPGLEVP
jgi:Zn-dependent protease